MTKYRHLGVRSQRTAVSENCCNNEILATARAAGECAPGSREISCATAYAHPAGTRYATDSTLYSLRGHAYTRAGSASRDALAGAARLPGRPEKKFPSELEDTPYTSQLHTAQQGHMHTDTGPHTINDVRLYIHAPHSACALAHGVPPRGHRRRQQANTRAALPIERRHSCASAFASPVWSPARASTALTLSRSASTRGRASGRC